MTATLTTVPTTRLGRAGHEVPACLEHGLVAGLAASAATTAVVVAARASTCPSTLPAS